MEESKLKSKIEELISLLNKLSYEEIVTQKQEIRKDLEKLALFVGDFQRLINFPKKPLDLELNDYPLKENHRDEIIKLLRKNRGYYSPDQICYSLVVKRNIVCHILRQLEIEGAVIKKQNPDNKSSYLWRIRKI